MATPTDRGYVVMAQEDDGTTTIAIAAAFADAAAPSVYATHVRTPKVIVHPEVKLVQRGPVQVSNNVVEVHSDDTGVVHVTAVHGLV